MSKRIQHQWRSAALNLAAAVLNLVIVATTSNPWLWPMNLVAALVSGYMTYWSWSKIKEIKQEEQAQVIQILSGHFG